MKDLKDRITLGEWRSFQKPNGNMVITSNDWRDFTEVQFAHPKENTERRRVECLANAELITLAGNLAQKYDPSTWEQKLSQFEKMEAGLKEKIQEIYEIGGLSENGFNDLCNLCNSLNQ